MEDKKLKQYENHLIISGNDIDSIFIDNESIEDDDYPIINIEKKIKIKDVSKSFGNYNSHKRDRKTDILSISADEIDLEDENNNYNLQVGKIPKFESTDLIVKANDSLEDSNEDVNLNDAIISDENKLEEISNANDKEERIKKLSEFFENAVEKKV